MSESENVRIFPKTENVRIWKCQNLSKTENVRTVTFQTGKYWWKYGYDCPLNVPICYTIFWIWQLKQTMFIICLIPFFRHFVSIYMKKEKTKNCYIFMFIGRTRGQGIIRIVVVLFVVAKKFWLSHFWNIFKVNKAQILTF